MHYILILDSEKRVTVFRTLDINEAYYWHSEPTNELTTYANNTYWLGVL